MQESGGEDIPPWEVTTYQYINENLADKMT
jgi:hypothetical protein